MIFAKADSSKSPRTVSDLGLVIHIVYFQSEVVVPLDYYLHYYFVILFTILAASVGFGEVEWVMFCYCPVFSILN